MCFAASRTLRAGLLGIVILGVGVSAAIGEDWPHWRGNHRNGIVHENSGWNGNRWVDSKPDWTQNVGEGASSPLVVGDQVFTLGHREGPGGEGRDLVMCLQAQTGTPIWTASYAARKYGRNATGDEGLYSGPSSTPEYDTATRRLYTLGSDGDLNCWDTTAAGARVWHRNLYDDYQMPQRAKVGRSGRRDYGYTTSPLIHNDWLLVEAGGPKGTVVALDKQSGREAWRSTATSVAGHTGGLTPVQIEGIPCVAVLTFDGLLVVRLDQERAGETVATYPWITDFANNIASVAALDDCVLITSEYNHRALCKLRITLKGAEKLWEQPFPSKTCTPVISSGRVYLAWNRLRAIDWQTGQLCWEGPGLGDAGSCVVTKDKKLIVWANRGDLILADVSDPDSSSYVELARINQLAKSDVWPHLAVAQGQILCRDRTGNLHRFSLTGSR